jgi:hypothetical protein
VSKTFGLNKKSVKMSIAEMSAHVMALLEEHEIAYRFHPRKAWGAVDIWEVQILPIKRALSYATALHEIGHLLGHHRHSRRVMVRERDAWRWARKNAIQWTTAMERHAQDCLAWYGRNNTEHSLVAETQCSAPNTLENTQIKTFASTNI